MFRLLSNNRIRHALLAGSLALAAGYAAACAISTAQELELGQQYAAEINRQLPIVEDPFIQRYMNQLCDRLARYGTRNLEYTCYVVNTDAVNAFAIPGGFVYVNRGLIERADNLSELAGVVAHEIAHVEERHGVEQVERVQRANLGLTLAYILIGRVPTGLERAAIEVGAGLVFARYSREAEREADALAVQLTTAAGIDPNGLVTFFKELLDERQRRPSLVEQWFSTHPLTEERIADTRELIRQIPAAQLRNLTVDTPQFHEFQNRLRRLPAPPPQFRRQR
jgi:predicted Zn-dependent protease